MQLPPEPGSPPKPRAESAVRDHLAGLIDETGLTEIEFDDGRKVYIQFPAGIAQGELIERARQLGAGTTEPLPERLR